MNTHTCAEKDENIRFFGKVVASISHEIKNVMAIINEKAGLLQDLTLMAQKGMPLDTSRVASIAEDMRTQIKRGDSIIKNMNKFAHSVDEEISQINLSELAGLVCMLAERTAAKFGVSLNFIPARSDAVIRTRPFLLEFVVWKLIQMAVERCRDAKAVDIEVEKSAQGAAVKFLLQNNALQEPVDMESVSWLLEILQAEFKAEKETSQMFLFLPEDISVQAA